MELNYYKNKEIDDNIKNYLKYKDQNYRIIVLDNAIIIYQDLMSQ